MLKKESIDEIIDKVKDFSDGLKELKKLADEIIENENENENNQ